MDAREILERSRNVVNDGWTQGALHRTDEGATPHVCPHGAMRLVGALAVTPYGIAGYWAFKGGEWLVDSLISTSAFGTEPAHREAVQAYARATGYIGSDAEEAASHISRWNDAPGREKAEVVAAFDDAIAALSDGAE
jgi:hypothetical protein